MDKVLEILKAITLYATLCGVVGITLGLILAIAKGVYSLIIGNQKESK